MSHEKHRSTPAPIQFLFENSAFLIVGTIVALVWANVDPGTPDKPGSYSRLIHFEPFALSGSGENHAHATDTSHDDNHHGHDTAHDASAKNGESELGGDTKHAAAESGADAKHAEAGSSHAHAFTFHYIVTDILMALFFAIAAKEVWESMLPGGALSNPRKAATPLLATAGGVIGPAALYYVGTMLFDTTGHLGRGWAVPCATDIAFSYLVARLIFGNGHPAIAFLLLLAIADDAAGLVIIAVFYPDPSRDLNLWWLGLTLLAIATCFLFRKLRLHSFWWYLAVPGVMSWVSFYYANVHPALGLVPIIPFLPHAHTDLGIFARDELQRHDTLNEFEHFWKYPVELILGLFALTNAGVVFSNFGLGTWLVLIGLLIGKPLGITLLTWIAEKVFRFEIPAGMNYRHIVSLGMVAGIGFTVALFVAGAAFPPGGGVPVDVQDSVKMGALGSFFAAVVAYAGARMLGVRPLKAGEAV
jgi:NhaA family Na+:H+ antiporter